eukprot:m.327573 g.327573  ORF g.327573 m.327573 type:complete len:82 (-) comp20415_c0_seq1:929-1174(-)
MLSLHSMGDPFDACWYRSMPFKYRQQVSSQCQSVSCHTFARGYFAERGDARADEIVTAIAVPVVAIEFELTVEIAIAHFGC